MRYIVIWIFFFFFTLPAFWFSHLEKIYISNFLHSQKNYEKKIFVLDTLLPYFTKIDDIDFLHFLKQETRVKNIANKKIFIPNELEQKLQEKPLSCEFNSASLFATYILKRNVWEDEIFSFVPKNDQKLLKVNSKFIWWNPYIEFVGNVYGKQTKNIWNFTGYGIYAYPISNALKNIWVKNEIKKFKKYDIIESLLEWNPIIFWYLQANKYGNIDTNPFVWYTQNGDKINGYVGQHTGLIIWASFFDNGDINEIYFYEWKNMDVQIMKYTEIAYRASFFDMMIVKNNKK